MNRYEKMRQVVLAVVALSIFAVSAVNPIFARVDNSYATSAVYVGDDINDDTLSFEGNIFDFGFWSSGVDSEKELSHTVVLERSFPLKGTLSFLWDDATRAKKDIAVKPLGSYSATGNSYTINEEDGRLEFPFELILSATSRTERACLTVQWQGEEKNDSVIFAKYLVTLNPYDSQISNTKLSFEEKNTAFISDRHLLISVGSDLECSGVILAPGSHYRNVFFSGMKYHTEEFPHGVKLLSDSAIYLPLGEENCGEILLDYEENAPDTSVSISAGTGDDNNITTNQTPAKKESFFTVNYMGKKPILNGKNTQLISINENPLYSDAQWNKLNSDSWDLNYDLFYMTGGTYFPSRGEEALNISAVQENNGGTLTLSTGEKTLAGTYRLSICMYYRSFTISRENVVIFVDYR